MKKMISKLRDFKHRLRDRRMFALTVVVICALIATSVLLYKQNVHYMQYIENSNRRAFSEMTESVRNIDIQLSKAVLTTDSHALNKLANSITANASFAKSALGQLPLNDTNLDNTQKYLAQVGDFTIYLSEKSQNNEELSDEDTQTLFNLLTYADNLTAALANLEDEYLSQTTFFGKAMKLGEEAQAKGETTDQNQFTLLEGNFQDYPSLIYDGPFSDHLQNSEPEFLKGKPEISQEEADKRVREFIGTDRVKELNYSGASENTTLLTYSFTGKLSDNTTFSIDITKLGGEVLWYLNDKDAEKSNLSMDQGHEKAIEFLKSMGKENMASSYYEITNNILTANLSPVENETKLYPDLIKVMISLADGEIVGYEAKGYIMYHYERNIPEFADIDVKAHINKSLEYESITKALIPRDNGGEVFAYQVQGTLNKRHYLVYLNANTGATEKIFLLLENENGILTQ